jgi:hypothetical protein
MIELKEISVYGLSSAGAFQGTLNLYPGLQVITAKNSYGKSLAATAIAWCLTVEPMFGISDNQPLCFPEAVRDRIDFGDGVPRTVSSSGCSLLLKHNDGRLLKISRAIKGDCTVVEVEELASKKNMPGSNAEVVRLSKLSARAFTMSDGTGGFQHFFFEWLGWPRERVATFRGSSDLYLENLAPLFDIDQAEGWTNVQALQISRYGQQKISEVAVEYLLGATSAINNRFLHQQAEQRDRGLRDEARQLADRVEKTCLRNGWNISWSGNGTLPDILERWSTLNLRGVLKREANVDLAASQVVVLGRIEKLRNALVKEPLNPANRSAPAGASQRAIDLKSARHSLSKDLNALRVQGETTAQLLESIELKIQSATDLLRYKTTNVGRLDVVECPTCHRDLDPDTFSLHQQSEESVAAHIAALERDRALLRSNAREIARATTITTVELTRVDEELQNAESALQMITQSSGPVREQMAKLAVDLASAERESGRLQEVSTELDELQSEIGSWIASASVRGEKADASSDLSQRVRKFTAALLIYLKAFGHTALLSTNHGELRLDDPRDPYVPYLDGRRLRSTGSASDHPRLVAAYSLALAIASEEAAGLHPGFVLLDEPLQQNPDPDHRRLFMDFLCSGLPHKTEVQTIIFTALLPYELERLKQTSTRLIEPQGEHFLKLIKAPEENPTEAEDASGQESAPSPVGISGDELGDTDN